MIQNNIHAFYPRVVNC